jgi:hypothetical protein
LKVNGSWFVYGFAKIKPIEPLLAIQAGDPLKSSMPRIQVFTGKTSELKFRDPRAKSCSILLEVSHAQAWRASVKRHHDDDVRREWTMIVLGLCAMLIATLTLAAVSMLLNIEDENKAATPRIF